MYFVGWAAATLAFLAVCIKRTKNINKQQIGNKQRSGETKTARGIGKFYQKINSGSASTPSLNLPNDETVKIYNFQRNVTIIVSNKKKKHY